MMLMKNAAAKPHRRRMQWMHGRELNSESRMSTLKRVRVWIDTETHETASSHVHQQYHLC